MKTPASFWTRVKAHLVGGMTLRAIEIAADLGNDSLRKGMMADRTPPLEIVLKIARQLKVTPAEFQKRFGYLAHAK